MRTIRDMLAGTVFISIVVAGAAWYAGDLEAPHWTRSISSSGGRAPASLPPISVGRVDWSADGRKLLSLSRGHATGRDCLVLHDALGRSSGIPIDLMDGLIRAVALAPDGRHALVATHSEQLLWVDLESLETTTIVELPRAGFCTAVTFYADGRLLAAATNAGRIYVFDRARRISIEIASEQRYTTTLRFSGDGKRLLCAGTDGSIECWEVSGQRLQRLTGHGQPATGAAFLACGKRIISASLDDSIRIWNVETGDEEWRGEFSLGGINTFAVSADGRLAAWAGFCRRIIVWDLDRKCKKFEIATPASAVNHLNFNADATLLAAAGREPTIRIYDLQSGIEQSGIEVGIAESL